MFIFASMNVNCSFPPVVGKVEGLLLVKGVGGMEREVGESGRKIKGREEWKGTGKRHGGRRKRMKRTNK